jgi:hypothetical protein
LFAQRLVAEAAPTETLSEDHDWKPAGARPRSSGEGPEDAAHDRPMRNITPELVLLPPPDKPPTSRRRPPKGPGRSKGV